METKTEVRFFKHVAMIPFHACWEWVGRKDKDGYGRFWSGIKDVRAHRFSFGMANKSISTNLVIDHKCRNRGCVNPAHLRQVTRTANVLENSNSRARINKRKTHCPQGHMYDRFSQKFGRSCRKCGAINAKNARNKNRVTTKAATIRGSD